MKVPEMPVSTLKILGHDYLVVQDPQLLAKTRGCPGEVNYFLNTITLSSEVPSSSQNETLLHEIIEVLNNRLDLNLPHAVIAVLSESLHQVLRDNKLQF